MTSRSSNAEGDVNSVSHPHPIQSVSAEERSLQLITSGVGSKSLVEYHAKQLGNSEGAMLGAPVLKTFCKVINNSSLKT